MSKRHEVEEAQKFLNELEKYPIFKEKTGIKSVADFVFSEKAKNVRELTDAEQFDLAFTTRVLVQANLPHRNPGNELRVWSRRNGDFSLTIQPLIDVNKQGEEVNYGFPYGNIPRLVMIYLCTQAIKSKKQHICLGSSLSAFMRKIGLESTGGRWGTITRFKDQLTRLLTCHISFTYDGQMGNSQLLAHKKANIVDQARLWWDPSRPDQDTLFDSELILNRGFFEEIIAHGIPINLDAVGALKNSPLAIDLYTWLTYRVVSLKKPVRIPWSLLAVQLGSNYASDKEFKRYVKQALSKIHKLWPELSIEDGVGGFVLKPSAPHVKRQLISVPSSDD